MTRSLFVVLVVLFGLVGCHSSGAPCGCVDGAEGPPGPQGPPGAPGAALVLVQRSAEALVEPLEGVELEAACLDGETVLGGGCDWGPHVRASASAPTEDGWLCTGRSEAPGDAVPVVAWALCAQADP